MKTAFRNVCLVAFALIAHLAAQDLTPARPKPYFDEPPWVHDGPPELTGRVWHAKPAPAGARVQSVQRIRIVDFGGNIVRRHDEHKSGQGAFNSHLGAAVLTGVDADGDGTKTDLIKYREFSMDVPFSGRAPAYDIEAGNAVFYGGWTLPTTDARAGLVESGINTSEGKNWTFITSAMGGKHCAYGVWLWKKEDFRQGGDEHRVSFDDTSRIGLHVMRFFYRMNEVRYVVQDGERFFISEYNFGTVRSQEFYLKADGSDPKDSGLSPQTQGTGGTDGVVYGLRPGQTRWAPYEPKAPYHILFDTDKAKFEKREFKDVQSVGFYVAKNDWVDQQMAIKWYGFEVEATVHRPTRPSETLDMAKVAGAKSPAGASIPAFYIAKCEIPYVLFHRVRRLAVAPQFVFDEFYPFVTINDGDMGSMDYGPNGKLLDHGGEEPVTDLTWLDAMLWCNMLSEYEGREPVYYLTSDFKFMQRRARVRQWGHRRNPLYMPKVYVKWDADGYRLPTPAEWLAAAGTAGPAESDAWIGANSRGGTHDVGVKPANAHGLHDLFGNVWEYTWDVGTHYDPSPKDFKARHTVLGGDFNYPADPQTKLASPYGDEPHKGHYGVGFRVVRRDKGLPAPPLAVTKLPESIPAWLIVQGEKSKGKTLKTFSEPVLKMVKSKEGSYTRCDSAKIFVSESFLAKFEVSYAEWKKVRDWGEAMGYVFNYDGDMGSMDYQTWKHRHSPDEPVTGITRWDALVWCNALSEMEGRKPCYYGKNGDEVVRMARQVRAFWSRRSKLFDEPELRVLGWRPEVDITMRYGEDEGAFDTYGLGSFKARHGGGMANPNWIPTATVDWSTDGYRLPTAAEWNVACKAETKTVYPWGDDPDLEGKHAWSWQNSEGKTQPVGGKPTNPRGFHDMMGNVAEMCWGQANIGKNQSSHENWNPKGNVETTSSHIAQGGSFLNSTVQLSSEGAFVPLNTGRKRVRRQAYTIWTWNAFAQVGLRPIRCEKRTHRRSGSELPESVQILDVNLKLPVTPLQGQTHRANLQRTGLFHSAGILKTPTVRWKFKTGGRITSCPMAYRDKAYIASDNGLLFALDVETGKEKWQYKLAGGPPYKEGKSYWGWVWPSSPTIKDGILYTGSNGGYVYALDISTGRAKWKTTLPGAVRASGSPLPAYGAVFVYITGYGKDTGLLAIHGETGQALTFYRNFFWGGWQRSISFADGCMISAGRIVDMRSGSVEDQAAKTHAGGGMNTTAVIDGKMYSVGGWAGVPSAVKAADYRTANRLYIVPIEKGDSLAVQNGTSDNTLAVWNDQLYFGTRQGNLYSCSALTGKRLWKTDLGSRTRCAPSISTVLNSESAVVYIGCDDGNLWGVDAVTGKKLWNFKTGGRIWLDPWIADGVLYVASDDGYLYALEAE
jgi:formylglycine-generating enzyme required for sulfatase activity